MPDFDPTPVPGRPAARGQGRAHAPRDGASGEGVDPPTVRSAPIVPAISGSALESNSDILGRPTREKPDVVGLPVPGDRVDVFVLEESIGVGGMGAVFRATDTRLDRFVALKILPPDQAVDPEVVLRYHQEGRAAARLDHENIARVYTIGDDGTYHYIAFEYIEGTTIRQRVERGGVLPVAEAIDYTLQIAGALIHAVERDVVHRDIKPSNIIVTPQGRAKLVDMGLARRFERGEDTGLTQSGMTLGTFDYISPEQARDPRTVDVRGDLYSLGCTLFHMLSGRPPFPEGTVLQKLLQHQEEPPPDIRRLNASVPDELASVLVKLMAKDRDRRYQSPDQLVRDLLAVGGSVGLRPDLADGLAWKSPAKRTPAWARRAVWGAPVAAFLLIVAAMAWWGENPAASTPTITTEAPPPIVIPSKPRVPLPPPKAVEPAPEPPRVVSVGPDDDLLRELLEAPPRSTILLSDEGPYDLRGAKLARLANLDLTIKAEAGVRPVIRLHKGLAGESGSPPTSLVDVQGGRLTLDGLEFVVDPAGVAIRSEDADLIIRRCTFRRSGGSPARSRPAAIVVRSSSARAADREAMLTVEASDFDGGQSGVVASGPIGVSIRDCTFGPNPVDLPVFWADNAEPAPVAVDLRVSHVSVLTGPGPVFRFAGSTARVVVRSSVFGPALASSPTATLVAVDVPDRLEWRGFDNLYARFGVYLRPGGLRLATRSYEAWADDPATYREAGSTPLDAQPWEDRQPVEALLEAATAQEPARAFRLALPRSVAGRPGARHGPFGNLPSPTIVAATGPARPPKEVAVVRPPAVEPGDDEMKRMPLTLPQTTTRPKVAPDPRVNDEPGVVANDLVPMPMPPDPERPAPAVSVPPVAPPAKVVAAEAEVIRTPRQFLDALDRPRPGVKTLLIAADADLTLPSSVVRGASSWIIRAEKGPTRPKIRFRPDPASAPAAGWVAWLTLPSGSLRLEGLDLLIPSSEPARLPDRSWAAIAVRSGSADLAITDCTVTIEGEKARSAVIAVVPAEPGEGPLPAPEAAVGVAVAASRRVSIKDSLIRVGGDLVDVAPGCPVDLDLDDVAIATGGTLVHGHGQPKGQVAEPIKLTLRQVTARVAGGLALLESVPGRPELPVANVFARDTILATNEAGTPLFRVDGQDDLDLLRDRIHWEGQSVAYHQIEVYRRDQTAQLGAVSNSFGLESWKVAVGRLEEGPIHGDQKFLEDWDPDRPPWTLRPEDIRLRPESPAAVAGIGSDLLRIPNPPAVAARP